VRLSSRWPKWIYRFTIIFLTFGIIYQGYFLFHALEKTAQPFYFPYDSFAYISIDLIISGDDPSIPAEISSTGSGLVVGTTINGNAAVLTANHVCNPPPLLIAIFAENMNKVISVTDFYGNTYDGKIILTDLKDDLCLLEVEGFTNQGVPLTRDELYIGEKVYSVAAPMAFFSPGMVPLLDGYYSGDIFSSNGMDSVYTVPAREGSSGSSILNSRGEIVGVVHSSLTGFQSVTICATQTQVIAFLLNFEYSLGGTLSQ